MTGLCYFRAGADKYDLDNQVTSIMESIDDSAAQYTIEDEMPSYEGLDEMLQKADSDGCRKVIVLAEENDCINLENAIKQEYHFNEVCVMPEQFYRMEENDQAAAAQQTQKPKPPKTLNGKLFLVECQANFPTPKNFDAFYKVLTEINNQYKSQGTVKFFFGDFIEGQQFLKCESIKGMMSSKILKKYDEEFKPIKSNIDICDCSANSLSEFANAIVNQSDCSAAEIYLITCQQDIANAANQVIKGGQIAQISGGATVKFRVIVDKRLATYSADKNKKIYDACVNINKKKTTSNGKRIEDKELNTETESGRVEYVKKLAAAISWFETHKERATYAKREQFQSLATKALVDLFTSDLQGVADEFKKEFAVVAKVGSALVKDAKNVMQKNGGQKPEKDRQAMELVNTKEYEIIVKEAELK